MRSSLRRFHSLRSLAQLARFIGRAPDTHAFRQVDVAQAALVASWHALLQSGQILAFDTVGFQTYSENEEDGILLSIALLAAVIVLAVVLAAVWETVLGAKWIIGVGYSGATDRGMGD